MSVVGFGYLFFFILIAFGCIISALNGYEKSARKKGALALLLIRFPRSSHALTRAHLASHIARSAELYERLLSFLPQITIEIAVPPVGDEIQFYLVVPAVHQHRTIAEVAHFLPEVIISSSDYYNPWSSPGEVRAGYLRQHKPYAIPLAIAAVPATDPSASILHTLSKLKPLGESAALQWIIRPAPKHIRRQLIQLSDELYSGQASSFRLLHEQFLVSGGTIGILTEKLAGPLFAVNCRVVVSSPRARDVEKIVADLGREFQALSSGTLYNELQLRASRNLNKTTAEFLQRSFNARETMILNAAELSGLNHVPL